MMERGKDGRGLFRGCNSISQKIFAHASSSESLEGGPFAAKRAWTQAPSGNGLKKRFSRFDPAAFVNKFKRSSHDKPKAGLGTIIGVLVPTFENMFGVLIFLRFYYIVGNAGFWQTSLVVLISFSCAITTVMSLSAIATNGPIEEGGTYFLISRALGPKLGGTVGIMYYLGVSLLSVLESLGAVEMLLFTFPGLNFPSANRVIGASIIAFLGFLVYFGIGFVSKLSLAFFAVVIYTMCSYYFGLFFAPRGNAPTTLTGLKWSTFEGNWNSGYDQGVSFSVALAIFFPCFTGILSGADRAKNLASPEKSIPTGTILAVTISLVIYLSYMGLWAAVGTRDYLLGRAADGTKRGQGQNLEVVTDVAVPLAILTQLGIIIASMAQALQCLITSPRLLQAIAADGVVPFLGRVSKTSKTGEPRAALIATIILCMVAAMIGSLDAVAPLVSICFLTAYAALNFSCYISSVMQSPSWRPRWKFYHWSAALVGTLLCIAVSFVIKWYWAAVALVIQVVIYVYIDYREVDVDWGTGLGGFFLHFAIRSILRHGHEARYTVNWRPQLLCLCKPRSARDGDDDNHQEFMSFVSQLKKGRGLCVVTTILEGTLQNMAPQVEAERLELENAMQTANVAGFARVMVAPSYKEGKSYAIQSSGLGALEPNTLVLGWPNKWHEGGHYHSAQVMLEILDECKAVNKAALLCMNLDKFPTEGTEQEGYVDVWWIVHDGGLLLMLAHLLKQHRIWRKCKLRVHVVAEKFHDPLTVKRTMNKMLDKVRIQAEVQVLVMDTSGLAPYTYDNTIRMEEALAFVNEVAQYRAAQEQQKRPELSKQALTKPVRKEGSRMQSEGLESSKSPVVNANKSGDRQSLDEIFKDKLNRQTSETMLLDSKTLDSDREHLDDRTRDLDNQSNAANRGRSKWFCGGNSEHGEESDILKQELSTSGRKGKPPLPATITKSQSSHNVDHILKKIVPAELSMLEGIPYQPRPRCGPMHGPKIPSDAGSVNRLNQGRDAGSSTISDSPTSASKTNGLRLESERDTGSSTSGGPLASKTNGLRRESGTDTGSSTSGGSPTSASKTNGVELESGRGIGFSTSGGSPTSASKTNGLQVESGRDIGSSTSGGSPSSASKTNGLQLESGRDIGSSTSGGSPSSASKTNGLQLESGRDIGSTTSGSSPTSASKANGLGLKSADPLREVAGRRSVAEDPSPSNSTVTTTESSRQKGEKETRWADESGNDLATETELEIIVEETPEDANENTEEGGGRGMVRTGSAGQLYPGSPHNSDYGAGIFSTDIPEEMVTRTWETFSQNYSPKELNERIYEESKNAKLVVVNLPDNYNGMEPARYMEFVEELTQGLPRVVLVHGSRKELWGADFS